MASRSFASRFLPTYFLESPFNTASGVSRIVQEASEQTATFPTSTIVDTVSAEPPNSSLIPSQSYSTSDHLMSRYFSQTAFSPSASSFSSLDNFSSDTPEEDSPRFYHSPVEDSRLHNLPGQFDTSEESLVDVDADGEVATQQEVPNYIPTSSASPRVSKNPVKGKGKMPERKAARGFNNLEVLESAERSRLFDTIDKFRELNISEDISLPQLVVVGDQSSGKSSLLEGITNISFPVANDLCTRFATQIVLRRADDDEAIVRASIIPGADASRDPEWKRELLGFKRQIPEAEFSEAFPTLLDEAAVIMGVPEPSVPLEEGEVPEKRFTSDILKIELSGPDHPHLTIVDVPGLFHNTSKFQTVEDKVLIRNLIQGYIQDPRTIIMAVMNGTNNFANQEVFQMAREVDPEGRRTVGIITKCDMIGSGDENGIIQIASNKIESLNHGWFCVKNRSTQEILDGVTIPERHLREREFFKKSPWNRLPRDRVGVESLKPFLGHLLYEHARDEFPKLVDEINKLVTDTEEALARLGASRTSSTEQRMYLTRIANEYENRIKDCLDAKFREVVGLNSPLKIRTHIQNKNTAFGKKMKALGHTRLFKNLQDQDDHNGYDPRERRDIDEHIPDPKDIYDWIRETYRSSRGPELPGLVNPNVVVEMFREQAANWKDVAARHVTEIVQLVKIFNGMVFERVVTDVTVRKKLTTSLAQRTVEAISLAYVELDKLVEDECCGILQTVNDYYAHTLSTTRQERVLARLNLIQLTNSQDGQEGTRQLDLAAVMRAVSLSNEDSAVFDIHDILKSYYTISLKRFTDNVILQVIERHLLGNDGPIKLLKAEYISGLKDEELAGIAREDYQVASARREYRSRLERAREAQKQATMISV